MVSAVYITFVLAIAVLGAIGGIAAHFWRAHATMYPEDLGLGEPLNTFTRDDYQWEKHVVGAEWNDAGYWDGGSIRNLAYYVASGFFLPLLGGLVFWGERANLVNALCKGLAAAGLNSPICF